MNLPFSRWMECYNLSLLFWWWIVADYCIWLSRNVGSHVSSSFSWNSNLNRLLIFSFSLLLQFLFLELYLSLKGFFLDWFWSLKDSIFIVVDDVLITFIIHKKKRQKKKKGNWPKNIFCSIETWSVILQTIQVKYWKDFMFMN